MTFLWLIPNIPGLQKRNRMCLWKISCHAIKRLKLPNILYSELVKFVFGLVVQNVFVKTGCPWQQQSQNLAKSRSSSFWPRPIPRGVWCHWSMSKPWMDLQSKFGYYMAMFLLRCTHSVTSIQIFKVKLSNIALCISDWEVLKFWNLLISL